MRPKYWHWAVIFIAAVLNLGLAGGMKTETPTQRLYGLVTVHWGTSPNTRSYSGFMFNNWVITAYMDPSWKAATVSILGGKQSQTVPYDNDHIFSLNYPEGGLYPQLCMLHLPSQFTDRGEVWTSKVQLPLVGTQIKKRQTILCFGNGIKQPSADYPQVSGPFRSADFIVQKSDELWMRVKHGQYGEKLQDGDSGGPCFVDVIGANQFTVIGVIYDGSVLQLGWYMPQIQKIISQHGS